MFGRSSGGGGQPPPNRGGYARAPSDYPQQGGYAQQGGYPQQGGYSQPGGYSQQRGGYDQEKRGYGSQQSSSSRFAVVQCPNEALARTNCVIVCPRDFPQDGQAALVGDRYAATLKHDTTGTIQPGTIGPPATLRGWMRLSSAGDSTTVQTLNSTGADFIETLDMEVTFHRPRHEVAEAYDSDEMAGTFIRAFNRQVFSVDQVLVFDFHGENIKGTIKGLRKVDLPNGQPGLSSNAGVLMEKTDITLIKAADSLIKLKGSSKKGASNAILAPSFKFEDMGIGGLDSEFGAIFRRAFASRVFPPGLVEKLGIQHVKGILLHGPPGTGKTLMARQIGKMLNAREPKIVNGPEILNKYVGASEENIRKLFADAEKEYKSKGDESGLHIIIFDELDAICKQRGSANTGTGVGDSVVNQLLSKMDGVDQLNNILIIGMTNRLDMIDEALLRPGRLEVHMEISLPDESGRLQILNIHTAKMRENGIMERDVSLPELAGLTKNFSGAEINGLVKSATSFAFNRHVKVGTMAGISDDVENLRVNRGDFMMALDEVHPAFGVAEEELQQVIQNGIIHYAPHVDEILRDGQLFVEQVRTSARTPLVTVLLHGPPGAGKTALAATIAQASQYPFIKLVSPESMVGMSEAGKIAAIHKVFADSYKSPLSVIVVDNIERLLEWVPIGPRFSNGILQTLMVLLARRPPKGRRLLIIATTGIHSVVTDTNMSEIFDSQIRVPPVSSLPSIEAIVNEVQLFPSSNDRRRAMQMLAEAGFGGEQPINVGVKKLLSIIEMARQEPENPALRLVTELRNLNYA